MKTFPTFKYRVLHTVYHLCEDSKKVELIETKTLGWWLLGAGVGVTLVGTCWSHSTNFQFSEE